MEKYILYKSIYIYRVIKYRCMYRFHKYWVARLSHLVKSSTLLFGFTREVSVDSKSFKVRLITHGCRATMELSEKWNLVLLPF